ncbi:ribonuclease [Mesorhizobium sp. Root157]|uniref:Rne/Rng family ribonuclease n=1 Tax=Mesorhizobium sp. Root157 TaxID=1736477 RepID=UPI0006FCE3BD|nr:ribonuclease E/G [Mesorhizobium sp. Root157]KQZ82004.1 ribonuclease [Mesorhizobium sp. Root157]
MPNKMLIDASHPEETRVVVVRGNRIEEFDFESQDKKQLKGNIYLARVTRVEPSLQAAFVEYGGNRHGFLAFSEIHPDYYQIPVADRQALLRAEAEEAEEDNHDDDHDGEERHDRNRGKRGRRRGSRSRDHGERKHETAGSSGDDNGESPNEDGGESAAEADAVGEITELTAEAGESAAVQAEEADTPHEAADAAENEADASGYGPTTTIAASVDADVISEAVPEADAVTEATSDNNDRGMLEEVHSSHGDDEHEVESVGAEDALEEVRNRRKPARRQYKIQEVIKRRQILLVQVVKEERGNKGAALTTYLSLAGRYSVLMPNTARGGGISRKITNAQDRKRLKEVVADLEVPQGMGVILRTAGESRTKAEIKRDYEYLMRLWENVRNLTLESTAPALVYEEGSLIKRSVRDLYNKDIDEVLVAGEDGYREAKDFMRMLMPSHAKVVQPYRDTTPIFVRSGIEAQLDRMVQPQVTLKSGGYLIINQTEALVSIDVNSGRSTKEHSIEETALHTNLEAAEEVARQLRLRDLAGLIVIDFIDMEENRNNRAVEKRLKDHLKNDRARIQVGRISHFGLLEMSRQRIRASVLESTMKTCPHCGGAGHVRSDSSVGLMVVRAIEEFLLKDSRCHITVRTPAATALYVLNHKRSTLVDLEKRFGVTITLETDESVAAQHYAIARGAVADKPEGFVESRPQPVYVEPEEPEDEIVVEEETADEGEQPQSGEQQAPRAGDDNGDGNRDRKRRKRRRRRGGRDREHGEREQSHPVAGEAEDGSTSEQVAGSVEETEEVEAGTAAAVAETADASEDAQAKKRRRGKRGGKRNRQENDEAESAAVAEGEAAETETAKPDAATDAKPEAVEPVAAIEAAEEVQAPTEADEPAAEKPKKPRRATRSKKAVAEADAVATAPEAPATPEAVAVPAPASVEEPTAAEAAPKIKPRASRRKTVAAETPAAPVVSSDAVSEPAEPAAEEKPKRGGWWQRKGFF